MPGPHPKMVQLVVQLRGSAGRRHAHGLTAPQDVSIGPGVHNPPSGDSRAHGSCSSDGVTEMTPADIRFITERIEQRLRSMAEHEAAIRADLHALATLTVPAADDHLLDVATAANWLGISRATMFRLVRNDPLLRHVKVGKRTLFRPEDLRAYAARQVAS